jgi:hypothetical protein
VLVAADKGTRITMSNAGATTITVNTSLFAAGDTLFITNIGAGACTITAGTATVSTASTLVLAQYDSGTLYFTSTGVAIWEKYQGATTSSSGLTKVSTGTFSAVANTSTTFDGVFTSSYKKYLVVSNGIVTSASTPILLQLRVAAATTATNYYGNNSEFRSAGTLVRVEASNATSCQISNGSSTIPSYMSLTFANVGNASEKPAFSGTGFSGPSSAVILMGFSNETAATYDGFILSVASGTMTGSVTVYGLAN